VENGEPYGRPCKKQKILKLMSPATATRFSNPVAWPMKLPRNVPECRHVREKTQVARPVARFGIPDDIWEILDVARSSDTMDSPMIALSGKDGVETDLILWSDWWQGNEDVVVFERINRPSNEPSFRYGMTFQLTRLKVDLQ